MGLGRTWIRAAEVIGFDAFIALWRVLTSEAAVVDDRYRVCVPRFSTFLRFQRNRLIETMVAQGIVAPRQIRAELRKRIGVDLHESHIERLVAALRA